MKLAPLTPDPSTPGAAAALDSDPPRAPAPQAAPARRAPPAAVFAGLALSSLLAALGTSIANVGLPALGRAFDASFQQAQWVVLAYLLAMTSLVVSLGRLGDLLGRRRLKLAGIVCFIAASAACAAAPSLAWLTVARAAQGLGAAAMMALSLAFAAELAGKDRAGRVMGMLGAMSAAGTALGPSLGGLLLEAYGWRALFLALLPPGALALGLAWRYLPAGGAPANRPRFDGPGTVLLAATLLAYALAMTLGRGHAGWFNLALLCLAGAGAWLFLWTEARVAAPLIQPALLRESALRLGCAANALVSTVMMATLVVGPFYLAGALGLDAGGTGLAMSAGPVAAALAGMPAGRLADRHGAGRMALLGLAAMAAGCALLALAPAALGVAGYIAPLLVLTAGYALFQAANGAAVMAAAPAGHRGVVSGLLTLSRNLGLVTGASAMGAVFAWGAGAQDLLAAPPQALAAGMRATFLAGAGLSVAALLAVAWRRA